MRTSSAAIVVMLLLSAAAFALARSPAARTASSSCPYPLVDANRPVAPPGAPAESATFVDPTAETQSAEFVRVSHNVCVAPFARLEAQSATDGVCIEEGSNVQDNTLLEANGGPVTVGAKAIVAHGAELGGDGTAVTIADRSACPLPEPGADPNAMTRPPGESAGQFAERRGRQALANALAEAGADYACDEVPAFISFSALNRSTISDGAILANTARLAPRVVLRPGYASYPGKSLRTQAQADTPGPFTTHKVRFVTAGDVAFMRAVLHVNECLARGYTLQYRDGAGVVHPFGGPDSVRGDRDRPRLLPRVRVQQLERAADDRLRAAAAQAARPGPRGQRSEPVQEDPDHRRRTARRHREDPGQHLATRRRG